MKYLVLILISIVAIALYAVYLKLNNKDIKMKHLGVSFLSYLLVLLLPYLIISKLATITYLSTVIYAIVFSFFGVFLTNKIVYKPTKSYIVFPIVCFVTLLIELFAFNYSSFEPALANTKEINYTLADLKSNSNVATTNTIFSSKYLDISSGSKITFKNMDCKISNVQLVFDKRLSNGDYSKLRITFYDESMANSLQYASVEDENKTAYTVNVDSSLIFEVSSKGNMNELFIQFTDVSDHQFLTGINFNVSTPVEVNILRIFLIIGITLLIFFTLKHEWYNFKLSDKKEKMVARFILIAMGLSLIVLIVASFIFKSKMLYSLDLTKMSDYDNENYSLFQQFNAFLKGQFNLDITPSASLATLTNPYDPSQRNGIYCLWDRAYYNNQYFSYFGIAPIILFYFPIYLISGLNYVPSNYFVQYAFLIIGSFMSLLFILELAKTLKKKLSLMNFITISILMFFCSGLFLACSQYRIYTIPVAAGITMMIVYLYFALKYYNENALNMRIVYLSLCALFFVLLIMARPNMALTCLFVVPIFLKRIFEAIKGKDYRNLIPFGTFIGVCLVGFIWIFYYNYARFDSIFEFGSSYQLTVSDIRFNNVSIEKLPLAIFHYFIQPLDYHFAFPYFDTSFNYIGGYEGYIYIVDSFGLFMIPCFLFIFTIPFVMKKKSVTYKATCILSLILIVVFAFISYCLAGVIERYMLDVMAIGMVIIIFALIELTDYIKPRTFYKILAPVTAISVFICLNLLFCDGISTLRTSYPNIIPTIRDFLEIF